jgi:hypothetical protein
MCTQNGNMEEPHEIGEIFERYVRDCLFVYDDYDLLEISPAYTKRKEYFAQSALKPDFKFKDLRTGRQFYVEVKFRRL